MIGLGSIIKGALGFASGLLGKKLLGKLGNIGKKVVSWVAPGLSGVLAQSAANKTVNASLTGKEQEQNSFNAEQAELQRQFAHDERIEAQEFNASQAQAQMAFQERMSNTQYQRQVADMQAAGVNPALAVGGIKGASASGAMAQVSPASGVAASGSTSLQGLSQIFEFAKLNKELDLLDLGKKQAVADIKQTEADTKNTEADTQGKNLQNILTETYGAQRADAEIRQIEQSISESLAKTGEAATRSALNSAMADLTKVQTNTEKFKQVEAQWTAAFIDKYHMTPQLAGELVKSAAILVGAGITSATSIIKMFQGKKGQHSRSITEKLPDGTTITDTFSGFPDM